jgi:hypothetical protein
MQRDFTRVSTNQLLVGLEEWMTRRFGVAAHIKEFAAANRSLHL